MYEFVFKPHSLHRQERPAFKVTGETQAEALRLGLRRLRGYHCFRPLHWLSFEPQVSANATVYDGTGMCWGWVQLSSEEATRAA